MNIKIKTRFIKLGQVLKMAGIVQTGGETKTFLLENKVKVNGVMVTARGKKIYPGDKVAVGSEEIEIYSDDEG